MATVKSFKPPVLVSSNRCIAIWFFALLSVMALGCSEKRLTAPSPTLAEVADESGAQPTTLDNYLEADILPADGFDFPVGSPDGKGFYEDRASGKQFDGWYIATRFAETYSLGIHPGEDWNGSGGGNTDLGQDVMAVAGGRVVFADHCGRLWGNVVMIEHLYYENARKKRIRSLYAHLNEIKVETGKNVERRQVIGTIGQDPDKLFNAHLHLELRWDMTLGPTYWPTSDGKGEDWVKEHYAEPSAFIRAHRRLPQPQKEPTLVLVDQSSYKMRVYQQGKLSGEYHVSLGQGSGQKRIEGDNKTPIGMYFVVQKHQGSFDGPYGSYYGGYWIKINYPNKFDALWGRDHGIITPNQEAMIGKLWEQRSVTLQNTGLGGGIGFHGWNREWDNAGSRHLSWGCVVMHLYDIGTIYKQMSEGSMVVIF